MTSVLSKMIDRLSVFIFLGQKVVYQFIEKPFAVNCGCPKDL